MEIELIAILAEENLFLNRISEKNFFFKLETIEGKRLSDKAEKQLIELRFNQCDHLKKKQILNRS